MINLETRYAKTVPKKGIDTLFDQATMTNIFGGSELVDYSPY